MSGPLSRFCFGRNFWDGGRALFLHEGRRFLVKDKLPSDAVCHSVQELMWLLEESVRWSLMFCRTKFSEWPASELIICWSLSVQSSGRLSVFWFLSSTRDNRKKRRGTEHLQTNVYHNRQTDVNMKISTTRRTYLLTASKHNSNMIQWNAIEIWTCCKKFLNKISSWVIVKTMLCSHFKKISQCFFIFIFGKIQYPAKILLCTL